MLVVFIGVLASLALPALANAESQPGIDKNNQNINIYPSPKEHQHVFPVKYTLLDSQIFTVQGQKTVFDGCRFPGGSVTLGPKERAVEIRSIAVDIDNCVETFEQGIPPSWTLNPPAGDEQDHGLNHDEEQEGDGASATDYPRSAGYVTTYWEDPVGIDVNKVNDATDFHYSGRCVHGRVVNARSYYWYKPSGWGLHENNWQKGYRCASSYSSSYVHYKNGVFCAFFDVDAYYDRTWIHGMPDGKLVAGWNSHVGGADCKDLLSFTGKLIRTRG